MLQDLLTRFLLIELIDSPLLAIFAVLAVALAVVVVLVRPRHLVRWAIVFVGGVLAGYVLAKILEAMGMFEGPLPAHAAPAGALAIGLVVLGLTAVFTRPWWRRVLAVLLVVCAAVAGTLAVNTLYGVTHTPAAILGLQILPPAVIPAPDQGDGDPATLYQRWTPPPDMPTQGTVGALSGSEAIPVTGFAPRDASLYLPPAALVADPPKLPLIVFMMGQPGTPDPTSLAKALDAFAAAHEGLAPIALVVDQLGAPENDPACADSTTFGDVSTYVNSAVPAYAKATLNIIDDPAYWAIGGFSNGGSCAITYGAQYPDTWGSILDVSGNEYPGSEHPDQTTADVFGGNAAAFEAAKPAALMAARPGQYDGHLAVFTYGVEDATYGPGQVANAALAQSAGFTVLTDAIAGAGHDGPALDGGLEFAVAAFAAQTGLAPPAP